MMKPSNEEVHQALITLQNLCSEFRDCSDCPLYFDKCNNRCSKCGLFNDSPVMWKIKAVGEWKAFE